MKKPIKKNSRRKFIEQNLLTGAGAILGINSVSAFSPGRGSKDINTPAILGGDPVWDLNQKPRWSGWPIWNAQTDEPQVLEVLRSGVWSRAKVVTQFENEWAKTIGAKRCLTTVACGVREILNGKKRKGGVALITINNCCFGFFKEEKVLI